MGYAVLIREGKMMANPQDGSQSLCSDVASAPFAHIPLVQASRRAELHISGQRQALSQVNQSQDNGQDYLILLQGVGVGTWEHQLQSSIMQEILLRSLTRL